MTSYYGRPVVSAPPWTHDIPAYLFLGGVAAASGLLGAGARFTGRPRLRRRSRVAALAAVGAGGAALAHDLGRPERFLNMMRVVKLTSPMSVGSWILAGFGACAGAAVATEAASSLVTPGTPLGRTVAVADGLAAAATAFFAPPLAAYTAVLLADTAVPVWNTAHRELPALFVASATAAGSGLGLVLAPPVETGPVRVLAALGAAAELAAGEALVRRLSPAESPGDSAGDAPVDLAAPLHTGRPGRLHAAARVLTAAGGLGAALAGRSRLVAAASGLALLAGSACTRFAVFGAGMASAADPRYTVGPQRARRAASGR